MIRKFLAIMALQAYLLVLMAGAASAAIMLIDDRW